MISPVANIVDAGNREEKGKVGVVRPLTDGSCNTLGTSTAKIDLHLVA
jgi:hypothetical protein